MGHNVGGRRLRYKPSILSWYSAGIIDSVVCATVNKRLHSAQRNALIKWGRRSVRRRRGILQPCAQLLQIGTKKPLGVRMGSGRGRNRYQYCWIRSGFVILRYMQTRFKRVSKVSTFFKRSNLGLTLLKQRL